MWCASVVRVIFGSLRASSAILRCRVEMTSRPNVPAICPSASSIANGPFPSAGSLGRVPRPHRYEHADSDFSVAPHFVSFARRDQASPSVPRGCRTLARGWTSYAAARDAHHGGQTDRQVWTTCVHAPLFDPVPDPRPRHCRADDAAFRCVGSAWNTFEAQSRVALCVQLTRRAPGQQYDARGQVPVRASHLLRARLARHPFGNIVWR